MKQAIIVRRDLRNTDGQKIRSGKLIAQGAHASLGAVLPHQDDPRVIEWLAGSFTKICLAVESEEELLGVVSAAESAGLIHCLITDNGLTEFGGVRTNTCCAIGPDTAEALAPITGHLKLL